MSEAVETPTCPGCHFGCSLDAYRCGRGKSFHALWREGKPVPKRQGPPMMTAGSRAHAVGGEGAPAASVREGAPAAGGEGAPDSAARAAVPPVDARIMHGLNITSNILQDRHSEAAERKVLMSIGRQGGFFATSMLGKRALLDDDATAAATAVLSEAGYVVADEDEIAGPIVRITPGGKEKLAEWEAERDAATAEFLAPLSDEERTQFAEMLFRLIQHQIGRKGR